MHPIGKVARLLLVLGSVFVSNWVLGATVSIQPANQAVGPGQGISVTVDVEGVSDLYAFQFSLTYPKENLAAQSVTEGPFLSSGGSTFFVAGAPDNNTGQISLSMGGLLGSVPGVNGSGTLATINFQTLPGIKGDSSLVLAGLVLLDSGGNPITVDVENAVVSSISAVPSVEPLGLVFLMILVIAIAVRSLSSGRRIPHISM